MSRHLRHVQSQSHHPARTRIVRVPGRVVRASFDAAVTDNDNYKHWANADGCSADAAANPERRRTLRNRARYEAANNCYCRGLVNTLANDTVGPGPVLQLLTEDAEANYRIEQEFHRWQARIGLARKLQTMRMARAVDGEAFAILANDPRLDTFSQLSLRLVEADRFTDPEGHIAERNNVDGIRFDTWENPISYRMLDHHPGGTDWNTGLEYRDIPASHVVHFFRAERPEQHRGLPEIMPALPLFAQLRRYTLAVIAAAETAADFAAVIQSRNPPIDTDGGDVEAMDTVELEKRMATVLPEGYELGQIKAEQPATTYAEFKREILNEIARCLNVPYNIAACNSSDYNYASGRLDHQTYWKAIDVDREAMAAAVLDPLFHAWLAETLSGLSGIAPSDVDLSRYPHRWFWPGREHVDPTKEAAAQKLLLASHTTTLAHEYARQGRDWETELRQRAKETKLLRELGLAQTQAAPSGGTPKDTKEKADAAT